jgi:hypothetical protein
VLGAEPDAALKRFVADWRPERPVDPREELF